MWMIFNVVDLSAAWKMWAYSDGSIRETCNHPMCHLYALATIPI